MSFCKLSVARTRDDGVMSCHSACSLSSCSESWHRYTHTHTHGSLVKTEEEYTYSNYPVLSDCLIPYSRLLPGKLTVAELLQKTPTFYIVNLAIP